jgi:mRNA interferase YafQ
LIETAIADLASGNQLDRKYHDHPLTGEWRGFRDLHIKPDLLLIYRIEKEELVLLLIDIGSHASLFGR